MESERQTQEYRLVTANKSVAINLVAPGQLVSLLSEHISCLWACDGTRRSVLSTTLRMASSATRRPGSVARKYRSISRSY